MPIKLPEDFDPEWYGATYPDVALSGLNAQDHYRLFGSLFGRAYKSSPTQKVAASPLAAAPSREDVSSSKVDAALVSPGSEPVQDGAIIDRPAGFDPADGLPTPARNKTGGGSTSVFSLGELTRAAVRSSINDPVFAQAAGAYARLCGVQEPGGPFDSHAIASCGASVFQSGATRIERAWLVTPSRLRLLLAGGAEGAAVSDRPAFRAYQALPTSPADLRMLGEGIQLPPTGPVFHDFELLHPLMPLLLELSSADGSTSDIALLPFPSLLPGGLHGAELKALQTEPNPMDDFWARSDALLHEALGGETWPTRAVTHVSFADEGSTSDWRALHSALKEWLSALFGISLEEIDTSADVAHQLFLPPNSVPTISALVSRRLQLAEGEALIGPYLVVDAETYRPRWSVAFPADEPLNSALPRLQRIATRQEAASPVESTRTPMAITIRAPQAQTVPVCPPELSPLKSGAVSVLVYASDASRAESLIRGLRAFAGEELDLFVSHDQTDSGLRSALNIACEGHAWAKVPHLADHRHIAKNARHETFLTVSDRVALDEGGRALAAVLDLLHCHQTAGSASCALLAEKVIRNEVVLQPASGGLFPTGVSFVSGPGLAFGEPDVQQALPDLTYRVVANTLLFTAWRRSALLKLPTLTATEWAGAADIRAGLDLMRAGYENWCTTQVTARLSGPYVLRDQIDPVGPGYLPPERWEEILRRVTVVRELF